MLRVIGCVLVLAALCRAVVPSFGLGGLSAPPEFRKTMWEIKNPRLFTLAMLAKHYTPLLKTHKIDSCPAVFYPSIRLVGNKSDDVLSVEVLSTAYDFDTKRSLVVADRIGIPLDNVHHHAVPQFDFSVQPKAVFTPNVATDVRQLELSDGTTLLTYSYEYEDHTTIFAAFRNDNGDVSPSIELQLADASDMNKPAKRIKPFREKNWTPIDLLQGSLKRGEKSPIHYIYTISPLVVVECDRFSGLCRVIYKETTKPLDLKSPAASLLRGGTPFVPLGFGYYVSFAQGVYAPTDRKNRLKTVLHGSNKNGLRRPVGVVIRANHEVYDYRLMFVTEALDLPRDVFNERNILPHLQECTKLLPPEASSNIERESLVIDPVGLQLLDNGDTALLSLSVQDATQKRSRGLVLLFDGVDAFFSSVRSNDYDAQFRLDASRALAYVGQTFDQFGRSERLKTRRVVDVLANPNEAAKDGSMHITTRRYITYSLYESTTDRTNGALFNAVLARQLYPDWTMRIYVARNMQTEQRYVTLWPLLRKLDVELLWMPMPSRAPQDAELWKFLVADDPSCERFIARNLTARLNAVERAAVDAWTALPQETKLIAHVLRNDVNRYLVEHTPMFDGLWGARGDGALGINIASAIGEWTSRDSTSFTRRDDSTHFLREFVWPRISKYVLIHEENFADVKTAACIGASVCAPFPATAKSPIHIGQTFGATQTLADCDTTCHLIEADAIQHARQWLKH